MGKLHELLSVEATVVAAAEKLLGETVNKFNKHTEFFSGNIRTLKRIGSEAQDLALEESARKEKKLPTTVKSTLNYVFPFLQNALDIKIQKHATNTVAKSDIVLGDKVIMRDVPVDFLLDLEQTLPKWRSVFLHMPTLDPSKEWVSETTDGTWKTKDKIASAQTEKIMHPVVLSPATDKHPAQVKEATKDVVVGTFYDLTFSGAATSQQKADAIVLCDRLIVAVKQARMRANSVDIVVPVDGAANIVGLFAEVFNK